MRLISFAVISLLAITVSAQPPLSTSADKDVITHKIQELWAAHQEQHKVVLKLEEPGKAEQEEQAIKSVMEHIEEQLKRKDLPEYERPGLEKHYAESVDDLEKAEDAVTAKQEQLDEAIDQRYDMEVKLNILEENLERKTEQDAKDKGKTGASPSLSPHRDILQEQMNEAFPNADDLLIVYSDIEKGRDKLNDVIKRAKNHKKQLELSKTWDKFVDPFDNLVGEFIFARYKCDHAKEFQADFGWQSLNSLTWEAVQSFWQIFSK
ncbi:hypothetical protein BASA62_009907 [Batrachochytrium salamandrivorans]|nr:hypothetical protein BASA62_009907 [Batrachochytrium salamandrivorans]